MSQMQKTIARVSRAFSRRELGAPLRGSEELAERVWHAADAGGAMFIWQMLLSF